MRVIILGPPGSGKGVQSKRIADRLDIVQISTGDILRQAVSQGTELGEKAKGYMNKGLLVPDVLMAELIVNRLSKEDCRHGFILDGYPRTMIQAGMLDDVLENKNISLDAVLELKISDDIVIQRLSNRRLCSRCGADYNLLTKPPREQGICDRCGASLYQREDDREETIVHRLEVYHRQTEPLEIYYRGKGKLLTFDAEKSVEEVSSDIIQALESLVGQPSRQG